MNTSVSRPPCRRPPSLEPCCRASTPSRQAGLWRLDFCRNAFAGCRHGRGAGRPGVSDVYNHVYIASRFARSRRPRMFDSPRFAWGSESGNLAPGAAGKAGKSRFSLAEAFWKLNSLPGAVFAPSNPSKAVGFRCKSCNLSDFPPSLRSLSRSVLVAQRSKPRSRRQSA